MSRRRLAVIVLLTAAAIAAGGARAGATAPSVAAQAWAQTGVTATFAPQDDRVYVAATAGSEEARAFVRLVGDDSLADATLVLVPADDGLRPDDAAIRACLLSEPFEGSGKLSDTGPAVDCAVSTDATHADDGSWQVPLAPLASAWAARGNTGLALIPDVDSAVLATFRLSFDTTRTTVDPGVPPAPPTTTSGGTRSGRGTPPVGPPASIFEPSAGIDDQPVSGDPPPPTQQPVAPDAGARPEPGSAEVEPAGAVDARPGAATDPSWLLAALAFVLAAGLTVAVSRYRTVTAGGGTVTLPILRGLGVRGSGGAVGARRPGDVMRVAAYGAIAVLALLPFTASDLTVYRASLIPVYVVAVFGLHVLVNWAGELSFAHGSMVAVPAFSVLALSDRHGLSPIVLLPVGVLVGIMLGLVVSLPAMKVRGVQVAIVTLAAGVAIRQFLLTKEWLVGSLEGYGAADATLGPLRFSSQRSLYALILVVTALALAVGWALLHSRAARAMFWVRDDPSAASAFGIPVDRYRMFAFAVAGGFAGLAGGMMVMALGRVTAASFPITLSLTYLVPVILVGPGFAGGIVVVALALQGAPIFDDSTSDVINYLGPMALLAVITRYRAGLHGYGRSLMERLEGIHAGEEERPATRLRSELVTAVGVGAMVAGLVAIAIGWYRSGNTDQLWVQNQLMLSGGLGGLALVLIGVCVVVGDRVVRSHRELAAELRTAREADAPSGSRLASRDEAA